MPRPSPSPFPTNRPNFFVEPSTTIESLRNSSTRCEPLASRCSSTPSKDPLVEKEEYHPKCALSSRHSQWREVKVGLGWFYAPKGLWGSAQVSTLGTIQPKWVALNGRKLTWAKSHAYCSLKKE